MIASSNKFYTVLSRWREVRSQLEDSGPQRAIAPQKLVTHHWGKTLIKYATNKSVLIANPLIISTKMNILNVLNKCHSLLCYLFSLLMPNTQYRVGKK